MGARVPHCACYDSRTICVSMFFVSLDGSDKRSCCKTTRTYERVDNYRAKRRNVMVGRRISQKPSIYGRFSTPGVFFSFFFPILFPYQTQIRAFFGDGVYVSLLDVPRCLPFYRDISKAFRISWTIREMFPATICNSSSTRFPRHRVAFNYDRGCRAHLLSPRASRHARAA